MEEPSPALEIQASTPQGYALPSSLQLDPGDDLAHRLGSGDSGDDHGGDRRGFGRSAEQIEKSGIGSLAGGQLQLREGKAVVGSRVESGGAATGDHLLGEVEIGARNRLMAVSPETAEGVEVPAHDREPAPASSESDPCLSILAR